MSVKAGFKKIFRDDLFVSEPAPSMFGNPANAVSKLWTNKNWLKSRFHFSFAEYHDPRNQNFGPLRVMNDDLVQPSRGFGTHGHANMEIVTYIVRGSLTHQDSMGTAETLGRGSIQFMTAGSGVQHSEHNRSADKDLRFIQMWITPRKRNLEPNYGSYSCTKETPCDDVNKFAHLVSDVDNKATKTVVKINQDCNMYVGRVDEGKSIAVDVKEGRMAYVLCLEGEVEVTSGNGSFETESMQEHDGGKVWGPSPISFKSVTGQSQMLVVEMKKE